MDSDLLRRYIRMLIAETPLARVPTQLLPPEEKTGESKKDDDDDEIEEFSAVGGMGSGFGFTAPLGASGGKKKKQGK